MVNEIWKTNKETKRTCKNTKGRKTYEHTIERNNWKKKDNSSGERLQKKKKKKKKRLEIKKIKK